MFIYQYKMKHTVQTFKALSDPTRLRIILLLIKKDLCVCELTFVLRMKQSRISHQLSLLKYAGIVEDRREGKWITYSIIDEKRKLIISLLKNFVDKELKESEEIKKDLKNLDICIQKYIRGKTIQTSQLRTR